MRKIIATFLAVTLLLSSSIQVFATVDSADNVVKPDYSTSAAGGTGSVNSFGGTIEVQFPENISNPDDWHNQVAGNVDIGQTVGNGTLQAGDPLCPDLNDPNWSQKQKDWAARDPDGYAQKVSEACGGTPSVSAIKDQIAKGNYPTVKYEPTANTTINGKNFPNMSSTDFIREMFPDASPSEINSAGGKETLTDIMNRLTTKYGKTSDWKPDLNDKSNPYSFLAGMMAGSKWDGSKWVPYNGKSLANIFEEWSNRGGNAYISFEEFLAGELGVDPEKPIPPPPPPVKKDEWKSKPLAYGEIKHNNYTAARSSEEWEAMAGIPHDETLYYDAGASDLSAEFKVKTEPKSMSGLSSKTAASGHNLKTCGCCGFTYCSGGGCKAHSGGPCSHPEDEPPSCPGSSYGLHSVGVTWQGPNQMTNYYEIDAYDVLEVLNVTEATPYLQESTISLSASREGKITVNNPSNVWQSHFGKWNELSSVSTHDTKCTEWKQLVQAAIDYYASNPVLTFEMDKLSVTGRDKKTSTVLEGGTIQIFIVPVTFTGCEANVVMKLEACINGGARTSISTGTLDFLSGLRPCHKYQQTNFMPGEQGWIAESQFDICGYNGDWASNERRDCKKHPHLFYDDNFAFQDRIVNGEKTTGPGTVTYALVPNGHFGSASAEKEAKTEYERGYGHVNNVVVHSPVALDTFYISCDLLPYDQRTAATKPAEGGLHWITPSMDFQVNTAWRWQKNVEEPKKGIGQTTTKKGNGYVYDLDTLRWIEEKYFRFPFEVIYEGDGKRYDANSWIKIPPDERKSNFTLPVSEEEVPQAKYDGIVIAKNSPHRGNPQAAWDEQAERTQNFTRDCGCQGDKEAPHGALNTNNVDVLGRIGNFTIDYTPDPNWSMFFSQKVTPEKWLIPNLVPEVNPKQFNKFLGPHHDIFDRMWWQPDNDKGRASELWPHGLDSYSSIPHYTKGHLGGLLPAAPGKNMESIQDLLKYEPIKMGYPVWWSIETIGNYGTSVARLQVHPKFYLFDTKAATPGSQQVDVYAKVGSSYKKIHDSQNRRETDYKLNYSTKLTHDERRLGQVEKDLTKLVVGSGDYSDMFNPANVRWLGTPNEMILTKTLRTFFGTQTFEGKNHQPNSTSNGTPLSHAEQAQRWHGTLLVPSSAKFTKPGEKDFIDTDGKYLMVVLEFTTLDANPWNIETEGKLSIGSNREVYFPWFEFKTPDKPKDVPPEHTVNIPPDTVVVFDPNNPSLNDVQIHGTY